jgi:hypothetical protein
MIKLMFGSFVAAIAMMISGFVYFAGPVALMGFSTANDTQSAVLQSAFAANLPETGTYLIPNPATESGTTLYGKGPVATVHYNRRGFSLETMDGMMWGFALYLVAAALMAGALSQLDRRVPDFKSRAVIVVCFAFACTALNILTDPIFSHQDWTFAIFAFVGDVLILCIGGLILARWFLPTRAEMASPLPAQKVEEAGRSEEVSPVNSPGL